MKTFKGNAPADALRVAGCTLDGIAWSLWLRTQQCDARYLSLKLCADGMAPSKANFWFGFDLQQNRMTQTRDSKLLEEHAPSLAQWCHESLDVSLPDDERTYDAAPIVQLYAQGLM